MGATDKGTMKIGYNFPFYAGVLRCRWQTVMA